MKCPDCTWLCACDYHSREYDRIDGELSSYHIIRALEKVNKKVENAVTDFEDKAYKARTWSDKLICVLAVLFFIWLATR